MRVAVLIISLCLVMIIGLQSCAVGVVSSLGHNENTGAAGAAGVLIAFIFLMGGALVLAYPRASMLLYIIGGIIGFSVAANSDFKDLQVWAFVSMALALMSYFGSRQLKKVSDGGAEIGNIEALANLLKLKEGGVLTDQEFDIQKETLLSVESTKDTKNKKKIPLIIISAVALVIIIVSVSSTKETKTDVNPLQDLVYSQPTNIQPTGKLADAFRIGTDYTSLQRDALFKEIKGKIVQWRLTVYEVSQRGDKYRIQTSDGRQTIDTFILITPQNQKDIDHISRLKTGDMVEFKGVVSGTFMRSLEISPAILILGDRHGAVPESTESRQIAVDSSYNVVNGQAYPTPDIIKPNNESGHESGELYESATDDTRLNEPLSSQKIILPDLSQQRNSNIPEITEDETDGPDFFAVTGVSSNDTLNIRNMPNSTATKVGEVPYNGVGLRNLGCNGVSFSRWLEMSEQERIKVTNSRWCKIEYRGISGWAHGKFLKEDSDLQEENTASKKKNTYDIKIINLPRKMGFLTRETIARSDIESENSASVGIKNGTEIVITGISNDNEWYEIEAKPLQGKFYVPVGNVGTFGN